MAGKKNAFGDATVPFYRYGDILSRNATFNIVIGPRGDGKTYGAKELAIKKAIRTADREGGCEQFILLRRFTTELVDRSTFFADIAHNITKEFPGYQFRVNGSVAQMLRPENRKVKDKNGKERELWETIGYFIALSKAQQKKSVSYHRVTTIIFDEFIIDKGAMHYLPAEVKCLLDFYITVDRYQERTRVIMISNTVSIMNPYFIEWNIRPRKDQEWIRTGDGFVCCHLIRDHAFAQEVRNTAIGRFIEGTEYGTYAVDGVFLDNHNELVKAKTSRARYYATIETSTGTFSWWIDHDTGEYFVQDRRPKDEVVWTTVMEKMTDEKVYMAPNDRSLQTLRTAFSRGRLFFSSAQARNSFVGVMKR